MTNRTPSKIFFAAPSLIAENYYLYIFGGGNLSLYLTVSTLFSSSLKSSSSINLLI
jgi:hypothetical protein